VVGKEGGDINITKEFIKTTFAIFVLSLIQQVGILRYPINLYLFISKHFFPIPLIYRTSKACKNSQNLTDL